MGYYQTMKIVHSHSHVRKFFYSIPTLFTLLLTLYLIASDYKDEVELFDFQSNKWESKKEWNYPFRNGRR